MDGDGGGGAISVCFCSGEWGRRGESMSWGGTCEMQTISCHFLQMTLLIPGLSLKAGIKGGEWIGRGGMGGDG